MSSAGPSVTLSQPTLRQAAPFLEAVARSRRLHARWVQPPASIESFRAWVQRSRKPTHRAHLVVTESGALAGVINVNEIVLGGFLSAYLGYYAFAPYAGLGYMNAGLNAVIQRAFGEYGLHRVEANIQPDNAPSIALVSGLGFRKEGFSPRYLKIAGRWRDHERWALTSEEWPRKRPRAARKQSVVR